MKAVLSTRPGPPETLDLVELPDPVAGPGEVVVEVRATALNFFDTLIIQDRYQERPPRPFAPGGECAGVVSAVGPGVTEFRPGDRVAAHLGWGGAQEKIATRPERLVALPDRAVVRARRGNDHHLWHHVPRPPRPRPPPGGRDAGGAGRLRRGGRRRHRARQADGGAGDRLRVVRGQARLLPRARRRRHARLHGAGPEGRPARPDRRQRRRRGL